MSGSTCRLGFSLSENKGKPPVDDVAGDNKYQRNHYGKYYCKYYRRNFVGQNGIIGLGKETPENSLHKAKNLAVESKIQKCVLSHVHDVAVGRKNSRDGEYGKHSDKRSEKICRKGEYKLRNCHEIGGVYDGGVHNSNDYGACIGVETFIVLFVLFVEEIAA